MLHVAQEPIHKLAWTLDACLNDRTLDARRTRELQNFFALHDTGGGSPARCLAACACSPAQTLPGSR